MDNLIDVPGSRVRLYKNQIEGYHRMKDILENSPTVINASPLGSGKTVMTIALSDERGLPLVVVSPLTVKNVWVKECRKYGTKLLTAMSYAMLRGNSDGILGHGFLRRHCGSYQGTDKLISLVKSGVIFVFDECQRLKNIDAIQHKAACAIVKVIKTQHSSSRAIFLSGSVFDKERFSYAVLRYLGLTECQYPVKFVKFNPHLNKPTGLADVYGVCRKIDQKKADDIYKWQKLDKKTAESICFRLYTEILVNELSFYISAPEIPVDCDYKNGFYNVTNGKQVKTAMSKLRRAITQVTVEGFRENVTMSKITNALVSLEKAKIPTVIRLVKETLISDPKAKVIVFYWYNKVTLLPLYDAFVEYNPMYLYGNVKECMRTKIVQSFQSPDTNNRLLIVNARTGGTGLSLDDTHGDYRRHVFCIPSYFFIDMFQCAGRVYRQTTKSVPVFRVIYTRMESEESKIMASLAEKTGNTKKALGYSDTVKVEFPGEYEDYYEPIEDA